MRNKASIGQREYALRDDADSANRADAKGVTAWQW